MKVANGRFEKEAPQEAQRRVPYPAILPRHCTWFDCASARGKAAAHDEIVTFAEFFHESPGLAKVVAIVSVAHDDPLATGGLDSAAKRIAIAFGCDVNDARAVFLCNPDGPVGC